MARFAPKEGAQAVGGEVLDLRQADPAGPTVADLQRRRPTACPGGCACCRRSAGLPWSGGRSDFRPPPPSPPAACAAVRPRPGAACRHSSVMSNRACRAHGEQASQVSSATLRDAHQHLSITGFARRSAEGTSEDGIAPCLRELRKIMESQRFGSRAKRASPGKPLSA